LGEQNCSLLVPRQESTGGKQKLGPISKQGDRYMRRVLIVGAHSVLRRAKQNPEKYPRLTQLLARRPFNGRRDNLLAEISTMTAVRPSQSR
jgi:transposase